MTSHSEQLTKVLPMLEVAYQSKHMKLAAIARRIATLKAQVAQLDRPRGGDLAQPSTRAGADVLWETWVMGRKTVLQRDIALASRDLENHRADVAQAFAKLEVARRLQQKLQAEDAKAAERRISW